MTCRRRGSAFASSRDVESKCTDLGPGEERERDRGDQHEGRTEHGVHEELHRGIRLVAVSPTADEEVHRNKNHFEEHEEKNQVKAQEDAHHSGFEEQQPGNVGLDVFALVRTEQRNRKQQTREDHEPQRDTVDAETPRDSELANPLVGTGELIVSDACFEVGHHPHAERECRHGKEETNNRNNFRSGARKQRGDNCANEWNQNQRSEERERNVPGMFGRRGSDIQDHHMPPR